MPQAHQRGLGDWQAELAVWPSLFISVHGAVRALAEAGALGLEVDAARMRANIDAHLKAIDGGAAAGDVEAAARRAGATARAQLAALEPLTRKPAP
jgi:3-carboxy-cis,cis-muconate cycloisomerase